MIACIGWGSLIWDPGALPVAAPWRTDGPQLPLEFARQSQGGRVTLVIVPNVLPSQTLWAPFNTEVLSVAREALRVREGNTRRSWIGQWKRDVQPAGEISRMIAAWAAAKPEISAALWAAMPPKWSGVDGAIPSENEVIAFLSALPDDARGSAEAYVRKAPLQIRTAYRPALEERLGWTATP